MLTAPSGDRLQFRLALFRAAPFALFIALTLFLTLHHEPWRDEADTWLYARDADALTLASRLRYMGTPGLWYFLLYPLAKLGLPYETQAGVHLVLAWGAAALLTWRSPLSPMLRTLFLFSFFISYEYAVVARSYVLTVLFLFAAATLYPRRFSSPLLYALPIVLLFHANAHSLGIAAALAAVYGVERLLRRALHPPVLLALSVMAASCLLSLVSLTTPPDPNVVPPSAPQAFAIPVSLGTAFFPGLDIGVAATCAFVIVTLAALSLAPSPPLLGFLTVSYLWLGYVFVFRYSGSPRHHGLLLVVLVTALWIARGGASSTFPVLAGSQRVIRRLTDFALAAALVFSCMYAAAAWSLEYALPHSGAKDMAAYLREHSLTGRRIAAHPAPHTESVLPYLPGVRFWYLGIEDFGTYMLWDETYRHGEQLPLRDALARLPNVPGGPGEAILLVNAPLPEPFASQYRLLHATRETPFAHADERFYLYEPVGSAPGAGAPPRA